MFIFMFGLVTFGLGWAVFWLMSPVSVIWALFYYGLTLGSPASATIGMRAMEIEMRTWYGAPAYFVLGAVHAIVYWISVSVLTPFIAPGRLLQRAAAAAPRHAGRHRRHQQPEAGGRLAGPRDALTREMALTPRPARAI